LARNNYATRSVFSSFACTPKISLDLGGLIEMEGMEDPKEFTNKKSVFTASHY
jgi:hypothetical protein